MGSVEAREIPRGAADVIVCEAFVGNVILKLYEGEATFILKTVKRGLLSTFRSKIGALLIHIRIDFNKKRFTGLRSLERQLLCSMLPHLALAVVILIL